MQMNQWYQCLWHRLWHLGLSLCLMLVAIILVSGCTSIRGRLDTLLTIHSTFSIYLLLILLATTTGEWSIVPLRHMEFQPLMLHRGMKLYNVLSAVQSRRICSAVTTTSTLSVMICRIAPGSARSSTSVQHQRLMLISTHSAFCSTLTSLLSVLHSVHHPKITSPPPLQNKSVHKIPTWQLIVVTAVLFLMQAICFCQHRHIFVSFSRSHYSLVQGRDSKSQANSPIL